MVVVGGNSPGDGDNGSREVAALIDLVHTVLVAQATALILDGCGPPMWKGPPQGLIESRMRLSPVSSALRRG